MCQDATVFRSMMLANTPCPINDASTGRLLMGRNAIKKYREDPALFVVGYELDKEFWDTLLKVGEEHDEAFTEVTTTKRSLSDQFRVVNAEQILIVEPEPPTYEVEMVDLNLTMTGQEKIDELIESLGAIKNRVMDSDTMTVGAVGYAALGGVVVDDAFNDALITETELSSYLEAKILY